MFSLSLGFTKYEVEKNGNKKTKQNTKQKYETCRVSILPPSST